MSEYDFHQLSPLDLELLVRDLLQAHWKVTIESFKGGRDLGVDLRYAKGPRTTIVQVKHYVRTGLAGLLRDLKAEATKLRQLRPTRYVLATSVPLSPANKAKIVSVFNSSVLVASDVLGAEELNNLLSLHPQIEQSHYKLWLASKAVLDRVLHNAAITRSEFKVRQVYRQARRYVASSAFPQAMEILDEERVVIISGPPGVGKTTLADLLLYTHLERGFQAVLVERDPAEGFERFSPDTPQIFYYDDFMGATFAGDRRGATLGNEDQALLTFINMVRETRNARLILTTREHVYSQALGRSERLREAGLGELRVVLHMPSYSFFQRAAILYNHIYFSDLPKEFQDQIISDGFYLEIVKHDKFNPRLIDWLSNHKRLKVPAEGYREFISELLDDPSDIWRHAYESEITEAGRGILLALWSFGGRANSELLRSGFYPLHESRSARYRFSTRPEEYSQALHDLANSFVRPNETGGVEVIDPSVLDLMNAVVREAPANAVDLLVSATSFVQVSRIWQFANHEGNGAVLNELKSNALKFSSRVGDVATLSRRRELDGGSIAYLAPSYEERVMSLLEMANVLDCQAFASSACTTFAALEIEWQSSVAGVQTSLALMRALASKQPWISSPLLMKMRRAAEGALNRTVSQGISANEQHDVIESLGLFVDVSAARSAGKAGFDEYATATLFQEDLAAARSSTQCADLIETLKAIGTTFDVRTAVLVSKVELEMHDLEEAEELRADHDYDAWRDQRADQRNEEERLAEMFSSLRGDR